jgi:hypothetical protein
MVATISPDPRLQFFANDGSFLVGGKLYTYAAGTTTPLATYTTSTGLIANTNPIILDSRGEASVWLGSSKYKFVLKTSADVEVWTQDQLQGYASADGSNATGTWPISITGNAATATTATTATYATTAGSAGSISGGYVSKIVAGTNITISPGTGVGDVTINAASAGGTVTSVSGAGTSGFTLTGGPITSSGTLTVTPPAPSTAGNVLTSDGTNWVSSAPSGTTLGGIGSYAFVNYGTTSAAQPGASVAGSNIVYAGAYDNNEGPLYPGKTGINPSGTWRVMGYFPSSASTNSLSLVVRIA